VIDVSALDVTTGDESYRFVIVGSDNVDFSTGDQEELQEIHIGGATALRGDVASDVGRYILPIRNKRNTRSYRFVRLEWVIAGTSPSITFAAFISKGKQH
jgi:hypothetical protein